jgi:serine/threonine protein kinase
MYEAFQDRSHIYIVMEYCSGGDLLERLLNEGRAMREGRVALQVALPMLQALKHMHAYHIIHRCGPLPRRKLERKGSTTVHCIMTWI